ncbi:DNA polymerase alpha catalytic subunit [Scaptodrosophila lebanonensis]|uniref:DNA polymerase n=1 Tax=Drosophila lebanonensis TaxID=7225 RepID=A0A6J2THX6_DROLE|nr:DNA polymerase alpha catalytic subunit [Scaptodrosophila lebanonensis]XP_030374618.1 DNA polymerase alpha catalytic subunit [Scaptodrosophila lebanonensis]
MADSPSGPRVKRQRIDKNGRFAAMERLRQLKGTKNKCVVDEKVDDVYEIVDEREYAKKANEKYGGDWIEDDGTGYAEDGRDFFEDEDEYSDEEGAGGKAGNKNKKEGNAKKRARESDKPAKGKASIRNLFSNAVPKKADVKSSVKDDDILADILGEMKQEPGDVKPQQNKVIAPAKIVGASSTRKSDAAAAKEYMNSFLNNIKMQEQERKKTDETSDDEMLERILKPKATIPNKKAATPAKVAVKVKKEVAEEKSIASKDKPTEETEATDLPDNGMDFSCFDDDENQFDVEKPRENVTVKSATTPIKSKLPAVVTSLPAPTAAEPEDMNRLLNNWESICQMDDDFEKTVLATEPEVNLNNEEQLRFWYWEAWEDAQKLPGEVFLFGRTADGKSICVRVQNINRVLYLLPRQYVLDPITKEPTKQMVTVADMYKEFNADIAAELKLDNFRSRKVTKNFAYHPIGIDVPQTCDYLEVHYDGKKPAPNVEKKKYDTIAHIFGANTNALERFLLDRKIKGPCWLQLKAFDVNSAPISWCKTDVTISDPKNVSLVMEEGKAAPPPPLSLITLNVRTSINPKTLKNEVCMISMLTHNRFHIDKPAPQPAFNRHMCGLTRPAVVNWPFDLNLQLAKYKSTKIYKHDSERALLSWFLAQYQQIDADLIVTYDAMDCQLNIITDQIVALKIPQWSRMGRLRLTNTYGKRLFDHFVGRMVCDVKRSAEECIRARSYDLQSLCQQVLKIKESERMDVNADDLLEMYEKGESIMKLISLTMQDASYMLRLMCDLNIMPLALQITNICGNTMTRTLQGGRSERNEFLLLHAFTEKNYIVPDRPAQQRRGRGAVLDATASEMETEGYQTKAAVATRKKAAYAGGLVLEPIRGLYEKFILLMDFNSLYPSIIQEYNICFTTVQQPYTIDELPALPDSSAQPGILPLQLRRLVESRREVKKLMAAPDLSPELHMQYHIRQMALKLTANSMYGCLGFAHSRFFAQHLAALVTHKGREILTNTQALVQKMNYDVVYGDTDSLMVNTNITDYDQVFKIGHSIKQSVNKMYKQLELDIDGVFSCLLLLKKKKYAAVKVTKTAKGELKREQEHKGLDIVRRDWSQLAVMVGKVVLDEVLSDKQLEEKLDAVHTHLERIKVQVQESAVPLPMYVITKQLTRAPQEYVNSGSQPHVQVALRMNRERNRRYKKGDMVDYVICEDGTTNAAMQRAYHLEELKGSEQLKLDSNYYLAHQIHPVVTRMVEVLEGTDASRIAECLGMDATKFRQNAQRTQRERTEEGEGESLLKTTLQLYRLCEPFRFNCVSCKTEQLMATAFRPSVNNTHVAVLQQCANSECHTAPYQYLVSVRNQLQLTMRKFVQRFYQNWLVCDHPDCNYNTRTYSHVRELKRPLCLKCKNGALLRQYSERDLYNQLCYFRFMFDLSKQQTGQKHAPLTPEVEQAYQLLHETVEQLFQSSAYVIISLRKLFDRCFTATKLEPVKPHTRDAVASTLADV